MAVNVAPKVAQAVEGTCHRLPITVNIGSPYGSHQESDLEQGLGRLAGHRIPPTRPYHAPTEYQDHFSETEEDQGGDLSRESLDLDSVAPTTSIIRALVNRVDGISGRESREPLVQIGSQVGTSQRMMRSDSPPWCPANRTGRYTLSVSSASTLSSSRIAENSGENIG